MPDLKKRKRLRQWTALNFWFWFYTERLFWRFTPVADLITRRHIDQWLLRRLREDARNVADRSALAHYEQQVFSQNGEDGVLAEIFKRIDTTNRFCVEFGCGNGQENCTRNLIEKGWSGLWIDGDPELVQSAKEATGQPSGLEVKQSMVSCENICDLFSNSSVPHSPDLCVIDIDGNDYWLWEQVCSQYSPRVVVVEINSLFPATVDWTMAYDPTHSWQQTADHSASLQSLVKLGESLGYSLVGCDRTDTNAFFIRNSELNDSLSSCVGSAEFHTTAQKQALAPSHLGWPVSRVSAAEPQPLTTAEQQQLTLDRSEIVYPLEPPQPNQLICIQSRLSNQSSQAVDSTGNHPLMLAAKWSGEQTEPLRSKIPFPVNPKRALTVGVLCYAPSQPGTYRLRITLVQEGVDWLDATNEHSYQEFEITVSDSKSS